MIADERLALEEELALERARRGLLAFTCYTKPDYQVNWHHRVIARHLNAVARGDIKRLMISVPPRCGKSELLSVRFPAFLFGLHPKTQIIAASYNATLAAKMNRSVQRVIDTREYQRVFPDTRLNGANARSGTQGTFLRNSDEFEIVGKGGFYRSAGVGGSATGYGMTVGIIDDPTKNREEANSRTYQERVWDWYTSTFYSRLEKDGAIVLCMTRWSSGDLVAKLLAQAKGDPDAEQWTVLNFPALCEPNKHPDDPRELDEPLWPEKYSYKRMLQMKATVGNADWASLYQQRPNPEGGGIINDAWWQWYGNLPGDLSNFCISADLSFEDRGDYSVFQVWATRGASRYLVDQVRKRMTFTDQIAAMERLHARYPMATAKLVEKAANGAALIDTLKRKIPGLIAVRPTGSKELRVDAVSPIIEAGNVYLPKREMAPWIDDFVSEASAFPNNGAFDDQVDAMSQALNYMNKRITDPLHGMGFATGARTHLTDGLTRRY